MAESSASRAPRADVEVRDAAPSDLPAIVAIYNATIPTHQSTADLVPVTVASRRGWFEDHSPNRRPLWVAERHGTVCGWLSFQDFYGRPAYGRTAEMSVYVDADHRGLGIGGLLLSKAIEVAPHLGLKRLLAVIFGHNAPSRRLFAKAGFELWGTLPGVAVLADAEVDVVIMGRATTPVAAPSSAATG